MRCRRLFRCYGGRYIPRLRNFRDRTSIVPGLIIVRSGYGLLGKNAFSIVVGRAMAFRADSFSVPSNPEARPATVSSEKLCDSQREALCAIALIVSLFLCSTVQAADSSEFWPEGNVFVNLGPRTRFFGDTAWANGKESDRTSLDAAGYLDISLKPRRKDRQTDDWQRDRLLWMRIGYDRIFNITSDAGAKVEENRGIISYYAKVLLPSGFVAESRARADLRWIGGDYSTRFRFREEITRELTVHGHTLVPFFNVEWFYDTRYDGWARILYQLGPEVTVNPRFRYEIYLAHQVDHLPSHSTLDALGLNLKWYF